MTELKPKVRGGWSDRGERVEEIEMSQEDSPEPGEKKLCTQFHIENWMVKLCLQAKTHHNE